MSSKEILNYVKKMQQKNHNINIFYAVEGSDKSKVNGTKKKI